MVEAEFTWLDYEKTVDVVSDFWREGEEPGFVSFDLGIGCEGSMYLSKRSGSVFCAMAAFHLASASAACCCSIMVRCLSLARCTPFGLVFARSRIAGSRAKGLRVMS